MLDKKKVLIGLSGGVDSTAAVLMLKEIGYAVTGFFMDVTGRQEAEKKQAEKAALDLQIPLICKDVSQDFHREVIQYFCSEYSVGHTPNPCVRCNPTVKFKYLLETADEEGIYWIATGHYTRVVYDNGLDRYFIEKGNSNKDQSYMMYRLGQKVLSRLVLPLGDARAKNDVRDMVRSEGIFNADTKDSQEICFIKKGSYQDFLTEKGLKATEGDFVDENGNVLGKHKGILFYTVGQRKGLGITFGKPMFVKSLDYKTNQILLSEDEGLYESEAKAKEFFFTAADKPNCFPESYQGLKVDAKIRYAAPPAPAVLTYDEVTGLKAVFETAQRAITPGQSIVFYDDNRLLGGGIIL